MEITMQGYLTPDVKSDEGVQFLAPALMLDWATVVMTQWVENPKILHSISGNWTKYLQSAVNAYESQVT